MGGLRIGLEAAFGRDTLMAAEAMELAVALQARGIEVTLRPLRVAPPVSPKFARMLTIDPDASRIPLSFVLHYRPSPGARPSAPRVPSVLWSRFRESEALPPGFAGYVDLTSAAHVEAHAEEVDAPVWHVAPGLDPDGWTEVRRENPSKTLLLQIATLSTLRFAQTYSDWRLQNPGVDVELLVATPVGVVDGIKEACPSVTFVDGMDLDVRALMQEADVLVSLDGSASANRRAQQMAATGGAVLVADDPVYSSWVTRDIGWTVKGDASLYRALTAIAGDRVVVKRRQERAASTVRSVCSWDRSIDALLARVERDVLR